MDHETLVAQSVEDLQLKTGMHDRVWYLREAAWNVDQDAGEIVFTAPNGIVATCPVQFIGTFNTEDSTWLWAWDNPSVQPELRLHAIRLREYGEENDISEYVTRKLKTDEDACWEFAALACMLNDAQGVYRGASKTAMVFMTFGPPRLSGTANNLEAPSVRTTPIVAPAAFTSEIPADVTTTVTGFINALYIWNAESYQAFEEDDSYEAHELITKKYQALIKQWCVNDVTPQGVSYSSHPSHNPDTERLCSAATADEKCWVRTEIEGTTYEYHLRREGGKWLIEHLYYLDDGGVKYECL